MTDEGRAMKHVGGAELHPKSVDYKAEQAATLARTRMKYTLSARFFFWFMDFVYGKSMTLPKIKLIEVLARIPYQAWELKAYWRLTFGYHDRRIREEGVRLVQLGRLSQDNEYWHLIIAVEKIREDDIPESSFWYRFMPKLLALSYAMFARTLAIVSLRSAFYFNAMFEDHAEHEYARFIQDHPELDEQPVTNELVKQFGNPATWGDVFRHIGLDERVHRNESLQECGRGEEIAPYVSVGHPAIGHKKPRVQGERVLTLMP